MTKPPNTFVVVDSPFNFEPALPTIYFSPKPAFIAFEDYLVNYFTPLIASVDYP